MKIKEFMELPDEEKIKYTQNTYPAEDKAEVWPFDFGVFQSRECEFCAPEDMTKHVKVYGTADSREPKFCEMHFIKMSQSTDFVKEVVCA